MGGEAIQLKEIQIFVLNSQSEESVFIRSGIVLLFALQGQIQQMMDQQPPFYTDTTRTNITPTSTNFKQTLKNVQSTKIPQQKNQDPNSNLNCILSKSLNPPNLQNEQKQTSKYDKKESLQVKSKKKSQNAFISFGKDEREYDEQISAKSNTLEGQKLSGNSASNFERSDFNYTLDQNEKRISFNPLYNYFSEQNRSESQKTFVNKNYLGNSDPLEGSQEGFRKYDYEQEYENQRDPAETVPKVNQPTISCQCKIYNPEYKLWKNIYLRLTSKQIEIGECRQNLSEQKKQVKQSLCLSYEKLIKVKIFPIDPQSKDSHLRKQNLLKLTYMESKKCSKSFFGKQSEKDVFFSFKKSMKYGQMPLPFFIFAKIIARKLKSNDILSTTAWSPVSLPSSLLLKRQLTPQQSKWEAEIKQKLKAKSVSQNKSRSRERAQTKKSPWKKNTKEEKVQAISYISGFIMKQSKHLKEWKERYTEIDKHGFHSYCDLKDWSLNGSMQKDKRPKQQTFTIFRSDKIEYLWTRFQVIDCKQSHFCNKDDRDSQTYQKGHSKILVIKMKHDSWKSHQMLSVQTQLGIPITNYCSENPNNWLYHLYRMLK